MIHVKGIDWQPIANMPHDRKDGRDMLAWASGRAVVVHWDGETDPPCWCDQGHLSHDPRYWADINPPEA